MSLSDISAGWMGVVAPKRAVRLRGTIALLLFMAASPALAIDCKKAADPVDRRICTSPNLVVADSAMNRAYLNLVQAAPDREIHDMLVNSQRRWLEARNSWMGSAGITIGAIRDAIGDRTRSLSDRSTNGFIARAHVERKLLSKYTGGVFAGFNARCAFIPDDPTRRHSSYICTGVVHAQNRDRICSIESDWATWRVYTYLGVSEIRNGKAVALGSCALGDDCSLSRESGWKRGSEVDPRDFLPPASGLPELDAEANFFIYGGNDLLDKCLTTPRFPPTSE